MENFESLHWLELKHGVVGERPQCVTWQLWIIDRNCEGSEVCCILYLLFATYLAGDENWTVF